MLEQRPQSAAPRITPARRRGGQPKQPQAPVRLDPAHEIEILKNRHVRNTPHRREHPAPDEDRLVAIGQPEDGVPKPDPEFDPAKEKSPLGQPEREGPARTFRVARGPHEGLVPAGGQAGIGMQEQDQVPVRVFAPAPELGRASPVRCENESTGFAGESGGCISAPPIDDDDLDPVSAEAPDERADAFRLVERRDHDRDHHGARA